ncbi:MAG: hypothetical protein OEZ23_02890 [Gammaproteobacteria bacterium]|nr:hypothetical protein [Gammaproteobacteria bacterium]
MHYPSFFTASSFTILGIAVLCLSACTSLPGEVPMEAHESEAAYSAIFTVGVGPNLPVINNKAVTYGKS